ncbi:hybrid sensor histidine kinase/response regulator [Sorangium sp. So ce295]|uniref:sensor histidine kinase n=1 Tax=Sorangium sp. So ce295 TaxID=3133295 RepID=UPI003F63922C
MNTGTIKVLLVDNDEEDCLLVKDILAEVRATRYDVTWVSTCEAALVALKEGRHDVCLLDYRLDGCTGIEILEAVHPPGCAIPIIMLTGASDREIDVAAMSAGATDYLVKGRIDAQLLERTIRYAIGHKAGEIELKRKNRQLVRMHEELAQKNAELQRLNEEKNAFVGIAAHDLRNPLGVIMGYSDFLLFTQRQRMNKEELEIVDKIRSSSRFMLSLLNDLLEISTIESGKLNLDKRSADLVQLVEANVGLNTVLASRKNMELRFEGPSEVQRVEVDTLKVEQVLNNLISNAIHYSPHGTVIRVIVRCEGAEVLIAVKDEGPGIAPEDVGNLFRPFGRASTMSTGGELSTGLGLAIARRIVEGHGGRIWVETELGRGATFFVSFPVPAPVSEATESSVTGCGGSAAAGSATAA